jgi:hypothetical protein
MLKLTVIIVSLLILLNACHQKDTRNQGATNGFPFNLSSPDKRFELPETLKEISGIAAVNDSLIACIGDELGIVYFYNLHTQRISQQLSFTDKGDFEDLTIIGETIYVLNSRGTIWVIKNYHQPQPVISSYALNIEKPFELEGLCQHNNKLFVAAKYYHNKKRDTRGLLPVWELALPNMQVQPPLFELPDFIQDVTGQQVPFHISALLYSDKNKEWFTISTHTKAFIRCDSGGRILGNEILTAKEFSQPEGMCFTPSGSLLISNEGKDGPPTILLFTPQNITK